MRAGLVRPPGHTRAHGWHSSGPWEQLPVYVISLPRSTERWLNITARLRAHTSHLTFVSAVDGTVAIPPEQMAALPYSVPPNANILELRDINVTLPPCCQDTWPTQLACVVSHLLAVKQAYLDGHELALVLEDDMMVLEGRWPTPALLNSAPSDWDALLLYMLGDEVADRLYSDPPGLWVPWQPRIWSAGAYFIRRSAMRRLLDLYMPGASSTGMIAAIDMTPVESNWEGRPIGGCVSENVLFTPIQAFVTTDFFFVETASESTLNSEHRVQHDGTRELVSQLIRERGFYFPLTNVSSLA
ncbi:hypothetical protein WJX81_001700 [Elliptochloris bilobata]|uniref:Glycosyl transferase family 25 domain-containing protein n=1 Tax=Elliptochloris bilobata TaxID=381761 RepID=A0AAW1QNE6_9CHLO